MLNKVEYSIKDIHQTIFFYHTSNYSVFLIHQTIFLPYLKLNFFNIYHRYRILEFFFLFMLGLWTKIVSKD